MRRIFEWLKKRFGTFDLLPEYFTAAGSQMQNILWGALLPFLAWGIWFVLGNPPLWVNATAVGLALFVAGYHVWRADHVRLERKLEIARLTRFELEVPEQGKVLWYGLEVLNTSEALTIESVSVQLEHIQPAPSNVDWWPIPLHLKHDNPPDLKTAYKTHFNLNPRESRHVDFVAASAAARTFAFGTAVRNIHHRVPSDGGRYRIQVSVRARDTPEILKWFEVWMDDRGILQCEME